MKKKRVLLQLFTMNLLLLSVFTTAYLLTLQAKNNERAVQPAYAANNTNDVKKVRPTAKASPTIFSSIMKQTTPPPTRKPSPTPPKDQVATPLKFGAVVEDYSNKNGNITALEQKVDRKLSTLSIFKQFGLPYNKDFDPEQVSYIKSQGMQLQFAWEPWNPEQKMNQSEDYLKDIPTGKHDGYIRETAQKLKSFGNPVNLRFGHEMNGDWYPWGRRPAEYVAAYKHIHKIFKEEGATNVKFMWCVNVAENPGELKAYYPGDEYVDVIGIDGFNFGNISGYGGWRSFNSIFGPTYKYLVSNYNKPLVIAEIASSELGGDKAAWVNDMFTVLPKSYPRIQEIIWFDLLKETDWRVDSSQSSLNVFKTYL